MNPCEFQVFFVVLEVWIHWVGMPELIGAFEDLWSGVDQGEDDCRGCMFQCDSRLLNSWQVSFEVHVEVVIGN